MAKSNLTPEYRLRLKNYYTQCAISEGSKLILFSLFFYFSSLFKEYLVTLFFLLFLRTNGGGIHCKKYRNCLLLSFFMILGNILLAEHFPPPQVIFSTVLLICLPLMIVLVPIPSSYRPKLSDKTIKKSKISTLLFTIFFILSSCTIAPDIIRNIGFWTFVIHTLQLVLAKILSKWR